MIALAGIALGVAVVALVVALWAYFEVRDLRDQIRPHSAASSLRRALLVAELEKQQ